MEGFGIEKLVLILVFVLVFFGAKRVPEIGASFGKGIREFKRGMKDLGGELQDSAAPPAADAAPDRTADVNADAEPKRLRG